MKTNTLLALALFALATCPVELRAQQATTPAQDKLRRPDVVFVPTPQEAVDKMLEMAEVKKDDIVYDLGCGDGRIVITAAKKYGAKGVGIDIDPQRVQESKENVKTNGVGNLVTIKNADIFEEDISKATVVTLYLLPSLNVKLIPQLEKLKPGTRIVSYQFDMAGIKPKDTFKSSFTVYKWVTPLERDTTAAGNGPE